MLRVHAGVTQCADVKCKGVYRQIHGVCVVFVMQVMVIDGAIIVIMMT
jgi:hypothetical protein